jgi:nucleoside-diphosphate-sugar epimerase
MGNNAYNIGISCIGSGVGQSIINSLRLSRLPIRTFGFGTNPFAYGLYDCDAYDYTVSIYQEDFIDNLIEKCLKHRIDLIIPGLDDEVLIYAQNIKRFEDVGIKAICADEELVVICRDKERMSNELNQIVDVFVRSYDKKEILEAIESAAVRFPLIAKPRGGFASRGIEILNTLDDLERIGDDHIIQEIAIPAPDDPNYDFYLRQIAADRNSQVAEISIQLVYSPRQELMGRMFSYNKLNNGVPIEIVPYENEDVWHVIDRLTPALLKMGLRGPINIQGRLTDAGLKLFEMNPRFTGITGLRALMGFNEVEACVKEWLEIDKGNNGLTFNYNRFGVRQTADRSLPLERNIEVTQLSERINKKPLKTRKTLFVTGATGYLGRNLVEAILSNQAEQYEIIAYGRDKIRLKELFDRRNVRCVDGDDLASGRICLGNADILLHLGFTRPHGTNQQIADSLRFTSKLFTRAASYQVPAIINISSQSVYGLETAPPWTEKTAVAPQTVYAQAKFATEVLLESLARINNSMKFSSLRLGTLAGGAPGLLEIDFLSKFVHQAIEEKPIEIVGGMQQMERFDIRDAVNAIIVMLDSDPVQWKPVYNLGSGQVMNLLEIAEDVVEIVSTLTEGQRSLIIKEERGVRMQFGMDSHLFYQDFNWRPEFPMSATIESLVRYFLSH